MSSDTGVEATVGEDEDYAGPAWAVPCAGTVVDDLTGGRVS
ncbi:hypothetical protein [Nocardiopsis halophila]|nr:hypothetical protein [Nocardiopsis halophila]